MSYNNAEINFELSEVYKKLQGKKRAIEIGVDNLENGKKIRDVQKKEILLREMKQVLTKLNDADTMIVKDLKGEAFDLLRSISKMSEAATELKDIVNNGTKEGAEIKDDVEALKDKVNKLGMDDFVSSLDIFVNIQSGSMALALEKITDAIFLHTPVLHPKQFFLELPEKLPSFQAADFNSKFIDIQIFTVTESLTFNSMILQKLMLDVTCQVPGQGKVVLEETSVLYLMEKNKAWLSEDGGLVLVQLRRPNFTIGKISVRVLGANIVNSPILHQFLIDESNLASLDMPRIKSISLTHNSQVVEPNVTKFDFLQGSLEVAEVYKSHPATERSRGGTKHCLESPCCITFLSQLYSFLVTEPEHNRVGLYEAASFKFRCWMGYPEQVGNGCTYYTYPTSVLSLENGFVALLEKHCLHIFDERVSYLQSIEGVFHGLAEGPDGEIFTLSQNADKDIFVKRLVRKGLTHRSHYQVVGKVKLSVVQNFDNGTILSKTRFLTYSQGKIFITDLGLHKLYAINLVTGEQTASGYMGSKLGQFKRPTGLVADDSGNLLIVDSENKRLVVCNQVGQLLKVVAVEGHYCFPLALARVDNTLLAVFMSEGEQGAIVRYRVKMLSEM